MVVSDQRKALTSLPPGKDPLSIVQGDCVGLHVRSGWVLRISPATRFEPRNAQHVMSRCAERLKTAKNTKGFFLFFCKKDQLGAQIFLTCLLLFTTCLGQLCAHHQEKIPYLCDTWY